MAALAQIITHSETAPKHTEPYGGESKEAGLVLVKDDGIYLMSNGTPGLTRPETKPGETLNVVAYAAGFDPKEVDRDELWHRTHDVSGDDFAEFLPLDFFTRARDRGAVKVTIELSASRVKLVAEMPKRTH